MSNTIYIRGVGNIVLNFNNIQLFREEIAAHKAYERNYKKGVIDRVSGVPCRSSNGAYLDGWYSYPNPRRQASG